VARNPKDSGPSRPDFEQALAELESLVERLERGDLPLDEALRTFERGVELTRHCQASLKAAQQKVEILLKRSGEATAEPFSVPENGGPEEGTEIPDPAQGPPG
jgi:exodeoxyribonuclease VII small subunit